MRRALHELVIVGLPTSQAFHLRVMDDPAFRRGDVDITYLERVGAPLLQAELAAELVRPLAVTAALLAEARRTAAGAPPAAPDTPLGWPGAPRSAWSLAARREALRS
jgi:acetyl/propionyl-CoA carboxylase alpha subunit